MGSQFASSIFEGWDVQHCRTAGGSSLPLLYSRWYCHPFSSEFVVAGQCSGRWLERRVQHLPVALPWPALFCVIQQECCGVLMEHPALPRLLQKTLQLFEHRVMFSLELIHALDLVGVTSRLVAAPRLNRGPFVAAASQC